MENAFIRLCALIARRAVNPCFLCFTCHKNLPWEESSHNTCIVEEVEDLRNNSLKKIEELLLRRELLRKYFSDVVAVRYKDFICYFDVVFETFFIAFLKTT